MNDKKFKYRTEFDDGKGNYFVVNYNPPRERSMSLKYEFTVNGKHGGEGSLLGTWNDDIIKKKILEKHPVIDS